MLGIPNSFLASPTEKKQHKEVITFIFLEFNTPRTYPSGISSSGEIYFSSIPLFIFILP